MTSPVAAYAASSVGSAHLQRGAPMEDASAVLDDPRIVAVAVADGVSDPRCPYAAIGAQLAVDVALARLADLSARGDEAPLDGAELAQDIVDSWLAATAVDAERLGIDHEPLAFATTIVFAAAIGDRLLLGKLGDGEVLAVRGVPARIQRPFPPEHGDGPVTLAHDGAAAAMGVVSLDIGDTELGEFRVALVCTDGYPAAFTVDDWRTPVVGQLLELVEGSGAATVTESLPEWVAQSAAAGGDDASLGLLVAHRRPLP